jgi:hypothetical protein
MVILEEFDARGENDLAKTRTLTVGNNWDSEKMKITVSCDGNVHGLWYIKFSEGSPPKHLQGKYTSYEYAKRAIDGYLRDHRQTRKITKEDLLVKKKD